MDLVILAQARSQAISFKQTCSLRVRTIGELYDPFARDCWIWWL